MIAHPLARPEGRGESLVLQCSVQAAAAKGGRSPFARVVFLALAMALGMPAAALAVGNGILIDGIHANDLSTVGLYPGVYEYHQTCGCRRWFDYLGAQGVHYDRVDQGSLTPELLSRYRMLFINLVSAERRPFLVSEIAAIRSFVHDGGSLLVVMDHSNAYFHAYRLMPLLKELDIEAQTDTTCEEPPHMLAGGNGWISITRFKPHPVTEGLQRVGMQSGGRVDPRFAVAVTSDRAWADRWYSGIFGEKNGAGYCGNFKRDPDEDSGPLGVVLAKDFGRGRIVIVADQNMIGETFLHYADNYRLWLNIMAWLLDDAKLRDARAYQMWRKPRIVLYEPSAHPEFSRSDIDGLYRAFALLTRYWWTFAGDRWAEPCDLLVFAYNQCPLSPEHAEAVAKHLRGGRNVLILNAESQLLDDSSGVVVQAERALGIDQAKSHEENGKLVYELPGCGRIYVLGPNTVLDNGVLAMPTDAPTEAQKQHEQLLLDAVRQTLPASPGS